jgi:hypothetical protein
MYKPILKIIKPGEKKSGDRIPKFDFSKRFAEMIKGASSEAGMDNLDFCPASDVSGDRIPKLDFSKGGTEVTRGSSGDIEANSTSSPIEFKPANAPKLDFQREGLLQMSRPVQAEKAPTSSLLEFSSESNKEIGPENPQVEEPIETGTLVDQSILDEAMLCCRSKIMDLEQKLGSIECEIPAAITILEERIGSIHIFLLIFLAMLHNLKLDFMLEIGPS